MGKYLTLVWRHFKRNKVFTLINTIGLTIGITCSLVMFVMVKFELGFDKHHENYERLYRIKTEAMTNGLLQNRIGSPRPLPEAVKADIAGVEEVTFFNYRSYGRFEVANENGETDSFLERDGVVYADPSFFRMFDWKFVEGDFHELEEPNTIVIDKPTAERFFGEQSALGKLVRFNRKQELKVVGVVEEAPVRTDFPFSIFVSLETLKNERDFTNWFSTSSNERCYVLLEKGKDPAEIDAQFDAFIDKHMSEESDQKFLLQPLAEVHFDMVHDNLNFRSAPWSLIYTLAAVSVLMILTACFNFINLSTAVALKRSREVGIRKVLGSTRRQLIFSFLTETLGITMIALVISLALAERLLPGMVSEFANVGLRLNLWNDTWLMVYLFALVVFITVLAGLYPAWIISAFRPANLIRGRVTGVKGRSLNLRRVLIIFQFALSQVFIIGTLIVIWQMHYVRTVDMGFQKEHVISLNLPDEDTDKMHEVWKADLVANAGVRDYSFAQATPFSGMSSSTDAQFTDSVPRRFTTYLKPADSRYISTYELTLLAGEGLLEANERNRYVVNEAFVKEMGFEDPEDAIGVMITVGGRHRHPISGVVKDYHMQTLKNEVRPAVMYNKPDNYGNLGIKIQAQNTKATMEAIKETWQGLYPGEDFKPVFLDEYINDYYQREARFFNMLVTFAIIAILISCLGLYGMISFIANQRSKEIGIRKVLGASLTRILTLFSAEFTRLVLVAFLVAAPLAYWGMQSWLEEFVYRITVGPSIFIVGMLMSLIITLFTIGYRSMRAGMANPVDSLRDE